MFDNTSPTGKGLQILYYAQVVGLICLIASLIQPISGLANIGLTVSGFICLFGLVQLSQLHNSYRNALTCTAATVVLHVVSVFIGAWAALLTDIVSDILNFLTIYFLIRATNSLLADFNPQGLIQRGDLIQKIYAITYGLSILEVLVGLLLPGIAAILNLICGIISIAALIQYITYLKQSSTIFLNHPDR